MHVLLAIGTCCKRAIKCFVAVPEKRLRMSAGESKLSMGNVCKGQGRINEETKMGEQMGLGGGLDLRWQRAHCIKILVHIGKVKIVSLHFKKKVIMAF